MATFGSPVLDLPLLLASASPFGEPLALLSLGLVLLSGFLAFQLFKFRAAIATENELLRREREQMLRAEQLSPVIIVRIGLDGCWVRVPPQFCALLGFAEDELLGHSVREVSDQDEYAAEWELCRALLENRQTSFRLEKRFRRKAGGVVWCSMHASVVLDKEGTPEGVLAYLLDITEKKRAEVAIQRSEAVNRQILEAVPGGYVLIGQDGRLLRSNQEALQWIGLSMDQLKKLRVDDFEGKTFYDDGTPCPPSDYPANRCLATHEPQRSRTIGLRRQDGTMVWGIFTANPMRDSNTGEPAGAVLTFVDITERKRAEEELGQAMEFLEGIIHKAPAVAVQVFDEKGVIQLWNPASERLYGFEVTEVLGKRLQDVLLKAEDVPAFEEMVRRLREQKRSMEPYEWEVRRRDGGTRNVYSSMFAIPRSGGRIGICCIDLDITERKQAEEELRRSEERYKAFIRGSMEAIWRFECTEPVPVDWPIERQVATFLSSAELAECNDVTARMYGFSRAEEIVGRPLREFLEKGDPRMMDYLRQFVESGYRMMEVETHEVDRDGNPKVFVNSLLGIVKQGLLLRCWGTQWDITARRQAEEALRRSETLLRQVLDALPVGVWVADSKGRLILGNPSGRSIWAGAKEVGDIPGEKVRGWWHQNGREIRPEEWGLARAIRNGEISLKEEVDIECLDGSRKTIFYSAVPIRAEDGSITGAIVVNEDITDRLRLETQLRHSQKMESIGQLAAGVAHDFNNLLTIIRGHVDLLLSRSNMPENTRESLEHTADAADRAASLTRQLLLFSNRQVIHPRALDLNAVVEDAMRLLRRTLGENIELQLECRKGLPNLYTDPGMIEQIVTNLAINARDAMPAGGRLRIRTGVAEFSEEDVQNNPSARAGRFLLLEVRDSGIGMDRTTLSRIFEPFFTTKGVGRGTGLGLATVYGIVQRHQGWIETESELGKGTLFRIYFPVDAETPEEIEPERKVMPVVRGGTETILVVEDESQLLELMRGVLEVHGYRILVAADGIEAMEVWQQNRERISLLLTDMMMPQGLSGRDLAQQFLSEKPGLRVILTSGYSVEAVGEDANRIRFLEKPYTPYELCNVVREVLDS